MHQGPVRAVHVDQTGVALRMHAASPQVGLEPRAGIHLSKVTAKEAEDTGMLVELVLEQG